MFKFKWFKCSFADVSVCVHSVFQSLITYYPELEKTPAHYVVNTENSAAASTSLDISIYTWRQSRNMVQWRHPSISRQSCSDKIEKAKWIIQRPAGSEWKHVESPTGEKGVNTYPEVHMRYTYPTHVLIEHIISMATNNEAKYLFSVILGNDDERA